MKVSMRGSAWKESDVDNFLASLRKKLLSAKRIIARSEAHMCEGDDGLWKTYHPTGGETVLIILLK